MSLKIGLGVKGKKEANPTSFGGPLILRHSKMWLKEGDMFQAVDFRDGCGDIGVNRQGVDLEAVQIGRSGVDSSSSFCMLSFLTWFQGQQKESRHF